MKKRVLKKIAILAAPVVWRRLRGKRSRRPGGHHRRHRHPHYHGHKRRGIWL